MILAAIWTSVMLVSAGVAWGNATEARRDRHAASELVRLGETDIRIPGPRWAYATGMAIVSMAHVAVLGLFGVAGLAALVDPDGMSKIATAAITYALFAGGLGVAGMTYVTRWVRQRVAEYDRRKEQGE